MEEYLIHKGYFVQHNIKVRPRQDHPDFVSNRARGLEGFPGVDCSQVVGSFWENHAPFRDALNGNPVTILTFREMVTEIQTELTTTLAATEVGRILQLFSPAGMPVTET